MLKYTNKGNYHYENYFASITNPYYLKIFTNFRWSVDFTVLWGSAFNHSFDYCIRPACWDYNLRWLLISTYVP